MILPSLVISILAAALPCSAQQRADPYRPLSAYVATRSGDVAWAVRDGKGVLHQEHGDLQIRSASIIKVAILAATLQKAADAGRGLTAQEQKLASVMIINSDNNAATALWNQLQPGYFFAFLKSAGLTRTVPDPSQPYAWGYTLTTAKDMSLLISRLYKNEIATPKLCRYGIGLMRRITPSESWGLKDGLPAGTWIAFKNGWYPETGVWRVNSVGAIHPRSRAPYFMAVLTRYDVRRGMGYGIETVRNLSRLAYSAQGK